ncbi:MAG: hypothetical protein ACRDSP_21735 [Pseudonocardiaceae bacterium]
MTCAHELVPSVPSVNIADVGIEIGRLQGYLLTFGYLDTPTACTPVH